MFNFNIQFGEFWQGAIIHHFNQLDL